MTVTIDFAHEPRREDIQIINDGIMRYAELQKDHKPIEGFAYFLRDENGAIQGGCGGDVLYGCLWICQLWITDALRHQGYGTTLVKNAEKFGKEKGCQFAVVNTMDWEGLGFYQKLGFYIEFERHGFAKDSVFYYLRKNF